MGLANRVYALTFLASGRPTPFCKTNFSFACFTSPHVPHRPLTSTGAAQLSNCRYQTHHTWVCSKPLCLGWTNMHIPHPMIPTHPPTSSTSFLIHYVATFSIDLCHSWRKSDDLFILPKSSLFQGNVVLIKTLKILTCYQWMILWQETCLSLFFFATIWYFIEARSWFDINNNTWGLEIVVLEADLVREIEELRNGGRHKIQARNVRWENTLPLMYDWKIFCERLAGQHKWWIGN